MGSEMAYYHAAVESRRSATETVGYLAIFSNAADWDRGVLAERARDAIPAASGSASVSYGLADLENVDAVRAFARGFRSTHDRLDALIHNAGVIPPAFRTDGAGTELTTLGGERFRRCAVDRLEHRAGAQRVDQVVRHVHPGQCPPQGNRSGSSASATSTWPIHGKPAGRPRAPCTEPGNRPPESPALADRRIPGRPVTRQVTGCARAASSVIRRCWPARQTEMPFAKASRLSGGVSSSWPAR